MRAELESAHLLRERELGREKRVETESRQQFRHVEISAKHVVSKASSAPFGNFRLLRRCVALVILLLSSRASSFSSPLLCS